MENVRRWRPPSVIRLIIHLVSCISPFALLLDIIVWRANLAKALILYEMYLKGTTPQTQYALLLTI